MVYFVLCVFWSNRKKEQLVLLDIKIYYKAIRVKQCGNGRGENNQCNIIKWSETNTSIMEIMYVIKVIFKSMGTWSDIQQFVPAGFPFEENRIRLLSHIIHKVSTKDRYIYIYIYIYIYTHKYNTKTIVTILWY